MYIVDGYNEEAECLPRNAKIDPLGPHQEHSLCANQYTSVISTQAHCKDTFEHVLIGFCL